jgi:hypothetical protein
MSTYTCKREGPVIWRLLVLLLVLFAAEGLAQSGKYQLRIVQESVDCATRKVVFSAQIKATSTVNQFILGSSNLTFTFPSAKLTNPTLLSRDNYSGGRYSQLNLNQQGSVLTLNVIYQGTAPFTDAPNVTTDWKSIAHFSFDIPAHSDGCYSIAWNTENDFPSTEAFEVVIQNDNYTEETIERDAFSAATGCAFASQLPVATLSGDTTIYAGEKAILKVNFTGPTPLSISLNGITYGNLTKSPLLVNVFPTTTTTYTLDSVFNACGKGTRQGSATVSVLRPTLTTQSVGQAMVCAGTAIQVPFERTGVFGTDNTFRVQLSDAAGANFTDIATSGTGSPLTATVPANTPAGTGYRVRVVSSNPVVTGEPSAAFAVSSTPTAVISGGGTIQAGGSANLTVTMTGKAPWTVILSDNSTHTTSVSPLLIPVSPATTTTYSLQSVTDACSAGTVSGNATVTVRESENPCKPLCVPITFRVIKQ